MEVRDAELRAQSNELVDAIDQKISAAQQSILDATTLFEKLLEKAKASDSGRLLEVNEQLLNAALRVRLNLNFARV